ncbi:centrosomin isoform X5 [Anthonomus grandis grandis]|uniref:centrosomin isoform X5 n=1 Tax=Anthonomus grandis grandis TaxID=2921223 RepID=UPI0021656238|nr:centrosomin isoform X5 [Anthonomus grandis grandis]
MIRRVCLLSINDDNIKGNLTKTLYPRVFLLICSLLLLFLSGVLKAWKMSFFNFSSGIFGSPPREASSSMNQLARSPSSPFCTSPSQLQEMTMDQDGTLSNTMGGVRSPGAARGRTVKEFEDQLTSLKKENFNLKLRIYFLEEKMGVNFNLNSDNIVKQNVELKVNLANLHSEANEKHKLLGEAVAALEIQDEELVKSRELIKTKEEEISQLQQELESVRLQLQDVRSFNNTETVSCDSGRRSEPEYQFATEFIPVVDSKEHRFGYSDLEKHQSQLANYVYDKAENLRLQIDSLQKDCELKDQTIESLNQELSSVNGRLIDFAQQVKEYEEKLAAQHQKVNLLVTKVQEEQKEKQKLKTQLAAVNQKFSIVKFEMEQEREELQRDRKSLERANMMLEMRVANLESKNRKQGEVMTEQLMKLERAAAEAKKNQELAVSCAPTEQSDHSNTDARFISVPDPETPKRFAQEGALHLQIESFGRAADKGVSASKNSLPSTPDGQNLSTFEHLLSSNMSGDTQMKIRSKFLSVKKDFEAQKQKIVTLKSDQLKACAIIKNMIAYQNKAKEEIAELKKAKKDLERELESVVSQPQKDKASIPLQAIKKSELNVESSVTSPANEDQLKAAKEEKRFFEERVTVLEQLDQEKEDLRVQLERSEQLRIETNDVCAALSSRLEELAVFLDSLLKQKSVLGLLGSAKNRKLREIISSSLDMSRSFNMSQLGNPDQSLAQLSNITAFLNGSVFQQLSLADEEALEDVEGHLSILPDNISLTYENHLYKKSNENERGNEEVIAALRQQVVNLKTELQVRDNELNRLQGDRESGVDRLSDSDGDNGAVQGFNLTPKSSSGTLKALRSEVNSESEAWSEPDRAVSRARIGLNRSIPVAHIPGSRYNHGESTEDEFFTPSKRRSTLIELSQDVHRLQQELDLKSEQFVENAVIYRQELEKLQSEAQESGEKFARAEVERAAALEKVAQLQRELDLVKEECKQSLLGKDKEMNNKINQLEMEKQRIMEESEAYAKQMLEALEKVKALEEYTNHMETKLRKEYEESVITKLKNAEETFAQKLKSVEEKCDAELKIAQENIKIIQEEYAKDYVRKSEAEKLSKELADLKSEVHSYEETIITYRELETTVQQYKKQIASLQADLDTTTALCCQLEKDNAEIGQEKLHLKDTVSQLKAKYEEQTAALQKQKSNLELRVSELESCNAELHNRLIKAQTSRFSLGLNATLPATIASAKPYIRQFSDHTYNSSEETADESHGFAFNKTPQDNLVLQPAAAEADRVESNSSPDLGIESDHGRFSSLETNGNNIIRPLLPTIELTESMNNLFDSQNIDPDANKSAHHCCQKSREIAEENNELKRKLHRMKTALEETATQLKVANQKKKLVEKNICKQLHKTSEVLRKAKVNLDSGSESDVLRS